MGRIVKAGVVGVDSGQIMISDPCYLDSEWDRDQDVVCIPPEVWKDRKTGKTYAYGGFNNIPEEMKVDVLFDNWQEPLKDYDGKTPNDVKENWERVEVPEEHSLKGKFSYAGACHTTGDDGYGQLNYNLGHPGAGVVSNTLIGDGCYPVFARLDDDGRVEGLAVDFRVADYDGELEHSDIASILADPGAVDSKGIPRATKQIMKALLEHQQAGSIWPAIRRIKEGIDMLEPMVEDMKQPLEGVEELQRETVAAAEATIAAFHEFESKMIQLSDGLAEEGGVRSMSDLKPLNEDETTDE